MFSKIAKKGNLPAMSVIDYSAFKFYRENSKLRKPENTPNYVEHGKILSKFYSKIGEKITESEGGVFIENLGYFSGVVDTIKHYSSYLDQDVLLNRHTSGYKFFLIFVPISKDNTLKEWVADSSFTRPVKKLFSEALKAGKKFNFNPYYFIRKYGFKTNK